MLKKFTFWLIPLLAIILQACAVDSVTTYHQDKTTSILLNIDMKELLGMAKNMGGDSANSDNKFKNFELFPKNWKNMYEIMQEDSEKKGIAMTKDKDSIQLIKKMFVKSNFENNDYRIKNKNHRNFGGFLLFIYFSNLFNSKIE